MRLRAFERAHGAVLSDDGAAFRSRDGSLRFEPPLVQSIEPGITSAESYIVDIGVELGERLGLMLVVLVRAGAFALGLWDDDVLLEHKAKKRYVVRGNGRAQATHLRTKGKSRYGSRLRLQNAQAQHEDLIERLERLVEDCGRPRTAWLSCPSRLLSDLYAQRPGPPLPRDTWRRIPLHVHEPDFAECCRVREALSWGRIVVATPSG